jgi:hypothetical protein
MSMSTFPLNANFELNGLNGVIADSNSRYVKLDFDDKGQQIYKPHQIQDMYIEGECASLKPMGRSTFHNYVANLDAYEVDKARICVKAASKKHSCVKGSIITNRPLERVEVDAVHLNIGLDVEMTNLDQPFEQKGANKPTAWALLAKHHASIYVLGKPKMSSTTTIRWSK